MPSGMAHAKAMRLINECTDIIEGIEVAVEQFPSFKEGTTACLIFS